MRTIFVLVLLSCHHPSPASPPPSTARSDVTIACMPARVYGAIPDDGQDDRAALQQGLEACAGQALELEAGRYDIFVPVAPRNRDILVMYPGETLEGVGLSTVLMFSGDDGGSELHAIRPAIGGHIRRLALATNLVNSVEQTHVVRIDGPFRGFEMDHVSCSHPAPTGFKSGDCVSIAGYPATATTPDRLVWDVHVHHSQFLRADRSGIAFHSGLRGSIMPDGHSTTRIDHNLFSGVSDQAIDGEGERISGTDTIEIDHNRFDLWLGYESAGAVQIQGSSRVHIHDNVSVHQAIDMHGCDACLLEDNQITLSVPSSAPVVALESIGSNTVFSDELYTRDAAAGQGYLLSIVKRYDAPDHVTIRDTKLIQHTSGSSLYASGIVGLSMRWLGIESDYDWGAAPSRMRTDAIGVFGAVGARTTEVEILDSDIRGPYRAAIETSGSLGGAGAFSLLRTRADGMANGFRCENVTTGSGVTGPIIYDACSMPGPLCSLVH